MPKKEIVRFALLLACVAVFLYISEIGCPILYITGISCPGCGMTRACFQLLQLDFSGAFQCHPLYCTLPILALLLVFYKKIPKALLYSTLGILFLLFLIVYVLRLQNPTDTIVRVDIQNSLLFRLFYQLKHMGQFLFSL